MKSITNLTQEPLGTLFVKVLRSMETDSSNKEALRKEFTDRVRSLSHGAKPKPAAILPKKAVKEPAKVNDKNKIQSFAKKLKNSILGKIELQRLQRDNEVKEERPKMTAAAFKAAKLKKKEDIADKVERQRNQRKKPKKKPTGAEGKDPKTVTSKKPPKWN